MKMSTNDRAAGKIHEVKGTVKQVAGELTNDPKLEAEGRIEKDLGKLQNVVGKIEKTVGK